MGDIYRRKAHRVAAIEWTGTNFPEVETFLKEWIGGDCVARNEPDREEINGKVYESNIVQFEAWGDDQEVDPGYWIVVYPDDPDGDGEIMLGEQFEIDFEAANS